MKEVVLWSQVSVPVLGLWTGTSYVYNVPSISTHMDDLSCHRPHPPSPTSYNHCGTQSDVRVPHFHVEFEEMKFPTRMLVVVLRFGSVLYLCCLTCLKTMSDSGRRRRTHPIIVPLLAGETLWPDSLRVHRFTDNGSFGVRNVVGCRVWPLWRTPWVSGVPPHLFSLVSGPSLCNLLLKIFINRLNFFFEKRSNYVKTTMTIKTDQKPKILWCTLNELLFVSTTEEELCTGL